MNGANTTGQAGIYGTMGMPAADNKPGARYDAVSWTDTSSNLWLFGSWSSSSTWAGGVVPPPDAVVVVRHAVTVQTNTSCYSLKVEGPSGNVTVKTGVQLIVMH